MEANKQLLEGHLKQHISNLVIYFSLVEILLTTLDKRLKKRKKKEKMLGYGTNK